MPDDAADQSAAKADPKPSKGAVAPPIPPGHVLCRVTKRGHDKVYTGETKANVIASGDTYDGPDAFPRHPFGAMIALPLKVAEAQEENGNVEIQE